MANEPQPQEQPKEPQDNSEPDPRTLTTPQPAVSPSVTPDGRDVSNVTPGNDPPPPQDAGRNTSYEDAVQHLKKQITDYENALERNRGGSKAAWFFVLLGLLFLGSAVLLLGLQWWKAAAVLSSDKLQSTYNVAVANANNASFNAAATGFMCGLLLELVALGIFYHRDRGLTALWEDLDNHKRFLLANIICEGMARDSREHARTKLIEALLEYGVKNQAKEDPKKTPETETASNPLATHTASPATNQGR